MSPKRISDSKTNRKHNSHKRKINWIDQFINSTHISDFETGLFRKVDFENIATWLKKGTAEAKAQRDRFYSMLCNVEYLY